MGWLWNRSSNAHLGRGLVPFLGNSGVLWFGIVRRSMVVYDKARASLAGEESPNPLDEDAHSQIGCGEKLNMDPYPSQPGNESAEMDLAALHNGKAFADNGHVPFVEVAERTRYGFPAKSLADQPACISALLNCNLSDARQWLPILLERGGIAHNEDFWMARHRKVRLNLDSSRPIGFNAEPFAGRRWSDSCSPDYRP